MRLYLGMSQRELAEKLGIYLSVYKKYENIPGYVMHTNFSRVCRIMELLNLNPNKFFMGQYELNEIGYEVASRGTTAPPKKEQIRRLQECCPVVYIRGVDKTTGEKIVSTYLR
jgi:transcriptional regulator with XRE-family HTH domain